MGSHSKKRKKDKKRSRSRSRSSERHRSRRRSRSSSRSRSRSPTRHKSHKHKKHKRRSSSRSRSRSRERYSHSRRSRSRSRERSSRRTSRSRSRERSSRRSSRSRSRERSSRYRRSRSRSLSRSPERRRRKRSKSRERQRSPDRLPEQSDSYERVKKEEESENDPPHLNPAEAIHQKMRKALEAAASADAKLREQGLLSGVKQEPLSRTEQVEREQVLQNLESDSFVPSAFVSSRERQVQPSYLTKEQTHENAIFGGVGVPNPAVNGGGTYSYGIPIAYKKRGQLASKYLSESAEVKEKRWLEKLQRMRRQKMEANPDYFKKLLTINAD